MADTVGMAEIRGIDIDKVAKGFADEEFLLKKYVDVKPAMARKLRYYKKTAGILTATSPSKIANVSMHAVPTNIEQSWTRSEAEIRTYSASGFIPRGDIKDSDPEILLTSIRDITRAVASQVDSRIFDVLTENLSPTNINTTAATGTGWDDTTNGNPILDIMVAKQKIRSYGYNPEGAILYINSIEHKNLLNYLITVKGSSIPAFSSEKVRTGVVMELLGVNVIVSENATTDYALLFVPQRACSWRTFTPITAETEEVKGMGTRIIVYEDGEAYLTDTRAVHLTTDTVT